MKRLTPFGIEFRKLRLDKGLSLLDVANATGRTSSFMSAVEHGLKPMPPAYVDEIVGALNVPAEEGERLHEAADRSRSAIPVTALEPSHRALVGSFARAARSMAPEELDNIRRLLSQHHETQLVSPVQRSANTSTGRRRDQKNYRNGRIDGEVPFEFGESHGFCVPPMSVEQIMELAERMRARLIYPDIERVPIAAALEFGLPRYLGSFDLFICDDETMEFGKKGETASGTDSITLPERIYVGAWKGNPSHRDIMAHELGHFLLHRHLSLVRYYDSRLPIYRDSEWQANFFAACFLMSRRHRQHFADARDAAARCGFPLDRAQTMFKYLANAKSDLRFVRDPVRVVGPTDAITGPAQSPAHDTASRRRLIVIFVADVAGFSHQMGIDEEGTLQRFAAVRAQVIDPKIREHHGELIKPTGDGVLVTFESPVEALHCAVAVQRSMAIYNQKTLRSTHQILLRIGIHQGDVILTKGDIHGDDVNIAFRLQDRAAPGGICVSARVHEHAARKMALIFDDMGQLSLKNITQPIHAYSVASGIAVRSGSISARRNIVQVSETGEQFQFKF